MRHLVAVRCICILMTLSVGEIDQKSGQIPDCASTVQPQHQIKADRIILQEPQMIKTCVPIGHMSATDLRCRHASFLLPEHLNDLRLREAACYRDELAIPLMNIPTR